MAQKLDFISLFSPGNCKAELLESLLVAHRDLVSRIERSIRDSVASGAGHHWLLIAPRGTGKTHSLAVLRNRIVADIQLRKRIAIAYLKEEERGVATYLDFLIRILRALVHHGEQPDSSSQIADFADELDCLTETSLQEAQRNAERLLVEFVGSRKLLLIVENLGTIFDKTSGMGKTGQQRFRDLVQQYPFWIIVASNQALFEDIQLSNSPFYGFFRPWHLEPMTVDQSVELLSSLAESSGRERLAEFFRSSAGKGRVKAIHALTGGNPRLLLMFYQFVDRESIEELSRPFMEMVDTLTSYYQEQMQTVSALGQKILEFLCENRKPARVGDIAKKCFIDSHQTTSSQLKRLIDRRHVRKTAVGREALYELSEPLFRICFEVKSNSGGPVRLFVDFLSVLYTAEELERKGKTAGLLFNLHAAAGETAKASIAQRELGYIESALKRGTGRGAKQPVAESIHLYRTPPSTTVEPLLAELLGSSQYRDAALLAETLLSYGEKDADLLIKCAVARLELGEHEIALRHASTALEKDGNNIEAWLTKARAELKAGQREAARDSLVRVLDLDEENACALLGLASLALTERNYAEAENLLTKVTQSSPEEASGWRMLGFISFLHGRDPLLVRKYLRQATALDSSDAFSWICLGRTEAHLANLAEAHECLAKAMELEPRNAEARRWMGRLAADEGDLEQARLHLEKAVELAPDDGDTWRELARIQSEQGDHWEARRSLTRRAELEPKSGEAWNELAGVLDELEEADEGRKAHAKATETEPGNVEFWLQRGAFELTHGALDTAEECFLQATDLDAGHSDAWRLLATVAAVRGDLTRGRECFEKAIQLSSSSIEAIVGLANLEHESGNQDRALELLDRAKTVNPSSPDLWMFLASAFENIGMSAAAHGAYLAAVSASPDEAMGLANVGLFLLQKNATAEALEWFEKIVDRFPDSGYGWSLKAMTLERLDRTLEALECFEKSVALAPEDEEAWLGLGRCCLFEGKPKRAEEALETFLGLIPEHAEAQYYLGIANIELDENEKARKCFVSSTSLDPDVPAVWLVWGRMEGDLGDYQAASHCFEKAVALNPEDSESQFLFATAHAELGNSDLAKKHCRIALEADENNSNALETLARLEMDEENHQNALEYLSRLAELSSDDPEVWKMKALEEHEVGDAQSAVTSMRHALELGPADADDWALAGWLEAEAENWTKAEEFLKDAVQENPNHGGGWGVLFAVQMELGNNVEALQSVRRYTELVTDNAEGWLGRGALASGAGDFAEAVSSLERATSLDPELPSGWLMLGLSQIRIEDYEDAVTSLHRACQLTPEDTEAWMWKSHAEMLRGNEDEARQCLLLAEQKCPDRGEKFRLLGDGYRRLGMYPEAGTHYRKAVEAEPDDCDASFGLLLSEFMVGGIPLGNEALVATLQRAEECGWGEDVLTDLSEIYAKLLAGLEHYEFRQVVAQHRELLEKTGYQQQFVGAITLLLSEILRQHSKNSLQDLREVADGVVSDLAESQEFRVICRLFATGVRYLESSNIRVLLELPLEERVELERMLAIETNATARP